MSRRLSRWLFALPLLLPLLGAPALASPAHTHHRSKAVCSKPARLHAGCNAVLLVDGGGHPLISATPTGLSPADIQGAYGLPATGGAGRRVAIVDAYNDPHLGADLAAYRLHYGLISCPAGCLNVIGQDGSTKLPASNSGWAEEESLDVDAVSAACPSCAMTVVEANSSSMTDLLTAELTAIHLPGVDAVTNSWGGSEPTNITALAAAFTAPGVFVTASSGDNGYGVEFPAASPAVVAVGGTTLTVSPKHTWVSETAWSGAGSGCSTFAVKPLWQTTAACAHRSVADVSADADPQSGLAVYDTYGQRATGWLTVGGTSLASPLVAAVHALAGTTLSGAGSLYAPGVALHDVTSGSNGSCLHKVLCTGGKGWDGPTGLGTPAGIAGW